jgi:hypothetical protein
MHKITCRRKIKIVCVYNRDDMPTSIGEVGISGSRSSPTLCVLMFGMAGRAQRHQPVSPGMVVNNFNFNTTSKGNWGFGR